MKIFLSPQVNEEERIEYKFDGDKVIITIGETTDTFDFTGVPEGRLELFDFESEELLIKTNLPVQPLISAEKKDGVLYLELLNWIPLDASESEKFPDWIDSDDYLGPPELKVETEEERLAREEEFSIMPEGEIIEHVGNSLEGWGEM